MTFFPDGKTFVQIGSFSIAWYAICIIAGAIIAYKIGQYNFKKMGFDREVLSDYFYGLMIIGIIGARIWYVIFMWNELYANDPLEIIMFRHGGLAIQGGILAGLLFSWGYFKKHKIDFLIAGDAIMPGVLIAQALGRWGNFFNREAFGEYTDGLFAMKLPVDAVRSSDITDLMRKHMETVDGVSYIQVSPTYLYESMWCFALLILLLLYRRHKKFQGEVFLMYLFGYGAGRAWIEGLRTDQLWIPGTEIPVSQVLAGTIVVVSFVLIVYNRIKIKKKAAC